MRAFSALLLSRIGKEAARFSFLNPMHFSGGAYACSDDHALDDRGQPLRDS